MAVDSTELTTSESRAVATAIREQLARRRISRQRLADDAKISISTLEKALSGSRPFTLATIVRLEQALGVALRPKSPGGAPAQPLAPDELGSYSRAAVEWLVGDYLTLRPSFEMAEGIYAYRTEIAWDEKSTRLVFHEAERIDAPYAQAGVVSVPQQAGHIYLHTNWHGQMRLTILGRPLITGEMYGVLTTLQSGPGTRLTPVATPIALIPAKAAQAPYGRIACGDAAYDWCRKHLSRVLDDDFVRFSLFQWPT